MFEILKTSLPWLTALSGFVVAFLAFRKDERAVVIAQITAERKRWRDEMRKLTAEIAAFQFSPWQGSTPGKIWELRARLATSINPKSDLDKDILKHFDRLFFDGAADMDIFLQRIALLLKHDWERVKWECQPLYIKGAKTIWLPEPDWANEADFRALPCSLLVEPGPKNRWPNPHDGRST